MCVAKWLYMPCEKWHSTPLVVTGHFMRSSSVRKRDLRAAPLAVGILPLGSWSLCVFSTWASSLSWNYIDIIYNWGEKWRRRGVCHEQRWLFRGNSQSHEKNPNPGDFKSHGITKTIFRDFLGFRDFAQEKSQSRRFMIFRDFGFGIFWGKILGIGIPKKSHPKATWSWKSEEQGRI